MRIKIELELEPGEIELANQIIATCKSLTDQVKISRTQGAHQGQDFARQEAPSPASPEPFAFTNPTGTSAPYGSAFGSQTQIQTSQAAAQAQPHYRAPSPAASMAPPPPATMAPPPAAAMVPPTPASMAFPPPAVFAPPQQQPPLHVPSPPPPAAAAPASQAPPPQVQPPAANGGGVPDGSMPSQQLDQIFQRFMREYGRLVAADDQQRQDEFAMQLGSVMVRPDLGDLKTVTSHFFNAWFQSMFGTEGSTDMVRPGLAILLKLPENIRDSLRNQLLPKILTHLTQKRPVLSNRAELIAQAEAFAWMVHMEFVALKGAIQTIVQLMRKEDTRCAAITMLGKTVELCFLQIQQKCEPDKLEGLRKQLDMVTDVQFDYDKTYIKQTMGWTTAALQQPPISTWS